MPKSPDHQEIEQRFRTKMRELAVNLDVYFNGDIVGDGRPIGFVLLVFPFGKADGNRCNYISNAQRPDITKLLREMAERFEAGPQGVLPQDKPG